MKCQEAAHKKTVLTNGSLVGEHSIESAPSANCCKRTNTPNSEQQTHAHTQWIETTTKKHSLLSELDARPTRAI